MAYRVTIPGSGDAAAGRSDSMGVSHMSEVPVSPVTEGAAPPSSAKGSDYASPYTTGEVPSPKPIEYGGPVPDLASQLLGRAAYPAHG